MTGYTQTVSLLPRTPGNQLIQSHQTFGVITARSSQEKKWETPYISPAELAERWRCGRTSVDRIARRAGFTRICLGEGRNGMIRYLREEVIKYEASRSIVMQ